MSTLTIQRLNERTHARLLRQAAENDRSVEAEVRAILDAAVGLPEESTPVAVHHEFSDAGGVDLEGLDVLEGEAWCVLRVPEPGGGSRRLEIPGLSTNHRPTEPTHVHSIRPPPQSSTHRLRCCVPSTSHRPTQ